MSEPFPSDSVAQPASGADRPLPAPTEPTEATVQITHVIYALYALGLLSAGLIAVAGLIVAYVSHPG